MKQTARLTLGGLLLFVLAYFNYQRGGIAAVVYGAFSVVGYVGGGVVRQVLERNLPDELNARYDKLTKFIWIFISLIIPVIALSFLCPVSEISLGAALFVILPLVEWSSEHHKLVARLKTQQGQSRPATAI